MLFLVTLFLIFLVYHAWFLSGTLSSGDWPYLFKETIEDFSLAPDPTFLWLAPYYQWTSKIFVQFLNIPWEVYERIFWFWPFLLLSILSSYHLTKSWIGVLVYTTNTYILMVVGGGQMGIALAYSIAPFVLKKFMDFSNSQGEKVLKRSIILGLALAVLAMFDPRVAYVTLLAIVAYVVFSMKYKNKIILNTLYLILYTFLIPLGIATLLNSYWIIPLLFGNLSQKYEGLSSIAGFEFLSFADFSHAFSLLHPNWPENIFGKTYFLQPEFLLLPILAYSSLLFLKNSKLKTQNSKLQLKSQKFDNNLAIEQFSNRTILFFALLGLIGTFLAKGANEPFGFVNLWMFENIPGMSMFRDSTKFYLLIALSYSVLIPFSLISEKVSSIKYQVLSMVFLIFWLFLISPAIFGQLTGTFKPQKVPDEYIQLKEFLHAKPEYFKSLWIPSVQRFGYVSKNHPALSAVDYLETNDITSIMSAIKKPEAKVDLVSASIKYIIIPYDARKELFITDRKYDEKLYKKTVEQLGQLSWLGQKQTFGNIVIFEVQY